MDRVLFGLSITARNQHDAKPTRLLQLCRRQKLVTHVGTNLGIIDYATYTHGLYLLFNAILGRMKGNISPAPPAEPDNGVLPSLLRQVSGWKNPLFRGGGRLYVGRSVKYEYE